MAQGWVYNQPQKIGGNWGRTWWDGEELRKGSRTAISDPSADGMGWRGAEEGLRYSPFVFHPSDGMGS